MAIIYSYPTKTTPNDNDLLLISDSQDGNITKKIKISTLPGGSEAGVSSITSANAAITVANPTSTAVVTSVAYSGEGNIGHVPTGGDNTKFLRGDGTWVVPTDTDTPWIVKDSSSNSGTVLSPNNEIQFLSAVGGSGTALTGTGTTADPYIMTISSPNTGYAPTMTDASLGLGKLRYTTGSTPAAEAQSTTANRTYGVTMNSSSQLVVNVPWQASSSVTGHCSVDWAGPCSSQNATGQKFYTFTSTSSFTVSEATIFITNNTAPSIQPWCRVGIYSYNQLLLSTGVLIGEGALTGSPPVGPNRITMTATEGQSLALTKGTMYILCFNYASDGAAAIAGVSSTTGINNVTQGSSAATATLPTLLSSTTFNSYSDRFACTLT